MSRTLQYSFIAFFLLISAAYAQPQKKSKKDRRSRAQQHVEFEEFEQAIPVLEDLLKDEPNSAYYNYWMGKSLYLTYRKNKALPFFEKVEVLDPDVDKEFHYYYGLTLHYNLKFDKAIDEYKKDLVRYEDGSREYVWVNNRISQCIYAKQMVKKREGQKVKIKNMGDRINTPYAEHSPVISANDSMLVFTARRPDSKGAKPEKEFYDEDVYVSFRGDNGDWSEAKNIGAPVNNTGHDATISLNADADRLYLYRHKKAGGLYVTDFDSLGKKWKEPRPLKKPFKSKYYEASICESADGTRKFFTSDRPGGFGGRDIYMLILEDEKKDKWSDPINVGPVINSPADEDAPYLHPDGKTLYYSSNGPNSMGGFDVFVTEMDTSGNWATPLNMGYPINTPDDDIYFVMSADGRNGYYSSGKEGGFGEKDIYNVVLPYFPYPRRFHIVELQGIVQDIESMDTLNATIRLVDVETNEILDSINTRSNEDQYYFVLEPEREYALEVFSPGYLPYSESMSAPELDDDDVLLVKNLMLNKPAITENPDPETPPAVTVFPEVQHLYFDFDKHDLRDQSVSELDQVIELLEDHEDLVVELRGHTDWYGTNGYNQELSEKRSMAAYEYLINKGVDPGKINLAALSENRPIETNENDQGRQFNRRTELNFYKGDRLLFSSVKLRTGVTADDIPVDHATPRGEPGYDAGAPDLDGGSAGVATGDDNSGWGDETGELKSNNPENGGLKNNNSGENGGLKGTSGNSTAGTNNTSDAKTAAEAIGFRNIYFGFDKYALRNESREELNKLTNFLMDNPSVRLEVQGHTDSYGSDNYNQTLSENRCEAAVEFMLNNGLSPDRIMTSGYSERKPMDTNDNSAGRQNNRRVEFLLIEDGKIIYRSQP